MKVQEVVNRVNNGDFNCIFDAEEAAKWFVKNN